MRPEDEVNLQLIQTFGKSLKLAGDHISNLGEVWLEGLDDASLDDILKRLDDMGESLAHGLESLALILKDPPVQPRPAAQEEPSPSMN